MQFLQPAGAAALAALGVIIALYLLKRQYQKQGVSSLMLWRRALRDDAATRPFQRLRRNVLMLLQLLCALVLALCLMRPALPGGISGETVLILDASMSMRAETNGVPRAARARELAARLIASLPEGDAVTVIEAGDTVTVRATRTTDKAAARRAADAAAAGCAGADMAGAVSLAQAMARQTEGMNIYVISDDYDPPEGVWALRVGEGADNRAIVSLEAANTASGWRAVARVTNYGADCEITLSCRADGELCDVRALAIAGNETEGVAFELPGEPQRLIVTLDDRDALEDDNTRYWVNQAGREATVALVGDSASVFLEGALRLADGVNLVRGDAPEYADLYVFEGALPDTLPEAGALMCVNPMGAVGGIACGAEAQGGAVSAADTLLAEPFTQGLSFDNVSLRAYTPLTGGQPVLRAGNDALIAVTEAGGRRMAVLGFDPHDTNLPIRYEFPLLMRRLAAWLLPDAAVSVRGAECGADVTLTPDARALDAYVITPNGRRVPVALAGEPMTDTGEIGVYTLHQTLPDGGREAAFTMHGASGESDVRTVLPERVPDEASRAARGGGREITGWLAALALLLLLLEWGVSRRAA